MARRKNKKRSKSDFVRKTHSYILGKEYPIDEIESLQGKEFFLDDDATDGKIKLRRANCYAEIGYKCEGEGCSTIGDRYILGLGKVGDLHLDLYGVDAEGDLHMITIDHIKPKSKGGKDHVSNYQPMCMACNTIKADKWEDGCSCDNGVIVCPGCNGDENIKGLGCAGCKGKGVRTCGKCGGYNTI